MPVLDYSHIGASWTEGGKFSILGASNEKSIFFQSYSLWQQFKVQNDILELDVALAKKMLHTFKKSMKNP